jgi:hypothetical protein
LILNGKRHLLDGGLGPAIERRGLLLLPSRFMPLSKIIGDRVEERGALQLFGEPEGLLQLCSCCFGIP